MKIKTYLAVTTLALFTAGGVFAAQELSAGKYKATLTPKVDSQTADNIEKGLDAVQQISSIKVNAKDSTVKFSVKDGERVNLAQLQDAVKAAAPDAKLGTPKMDENSSATSGTSGSSGSMSSGSSSKSSGKNSGKNTGSNSNY
jgi:hypothetical protein